MLQPYKRNRTPTRGLKGGITPFEAWTGIKPSVYHLRPFGCKVRLHIPDTKRKKLDPKSWAGMFLWDIPWKEKAIEFGIQRKLRY